MRNEITAKECLFSVLIFGSARDSFTKMLGSHKQGGWASFGMAYIWPIKYSKRINQWALHLKICLIAVTGLRTLKHMRYGRKALLHIA